MINALKFQGQHAPNALLVKRLIFQSRHSSTKAPPTQRLSSIMSGSKSSSPPGIANLMNRLTSTKNASAEQQQPSNSNNASGFNEGRNVNNRNNGDRFNNENRYNNNNNNNNGSRYNNQGFNGNGNRYNSQSSNGNGSRYNNETSNGNGNRTRYNDNRANYGNGNRYNNGNGNRNNTGYSNRNDNSGYGNRNDNSGYGNRSDYRNRGYNQNDRSYGNNNRGSRYNNDQQVDADAAMSKRKLHQKYREQHPDNPTAEKVSLDDLVETVKVKADPQSKHVQKKQFQKEWNKPNGKHRSTHVAPVKEQHVQQPQRKKVKDIERPKPTLTIPKFISLSNFAHILNTSFNKLINQMEKMGYTDLSHDYILDEENASLVADELGFKVVMDDSLGLDIFPEPPPKDLSNVPVRPPIVTIMGHVDHGKTTILDYLRKSSVAAGEHGGITQHIGAFSVKLSSNREICFLDTPGHAAFLTMRERGANVTDIVVLVVAADDSVMPQTKEAIKHAQTAGVPIIVAINKMDKPGANPDKVIADLAANGVDVEAYGGETQTIPVSGKTGLGIDQLEEAIITLSEILEIKAPKTGNAEGWVIESQIKKGQGSSATVLVRRGTLKVGSYIVAGQCWCKVRSMKDSYGKALKQAGPGTPVEITGWKELPQAGDEILQAKDETLAKKVTENRIARAKLIKEAEDVAIMNEQRKMAHLEQEKEQLKLERIKAGLTPELTNDKNGKEAEDIEADEKGPKITQFIVKADVSGSAEAVADSIDGLGNEEVKSAVLYKGVGPITDTDLARAEAAGAHLITFNVNTDRDILNKAHSKHLKIHEHRIIYKLIEEVTDTLASQLKPDIKHKVLGEATIKEIFEISVKHGKNKTLYVAGTRVTNGSIQKNSKVKVIRGGSGDESNVVYTGTLSSLKRFKDEVDEVKKDNDCGMAFDNWADFKPGDVIQAYEEITIPRHL